MYACMHVTMSVRDNNHGWLGAMSRGFRCPSERHCGIQTHPVSEVQKEATRKTPCLRSHQTYVGETVTQTESVWGKPPQTKCTVFSHDIVFSCGTCDTCVLSSRVIQYKFCPLSAEAHRPGDRLGSSDTRRSTLCKRTERSTDVTAVAVTSHGRQYGSVTFKTPPVHRWAQKGHNGTAPFARSAREGKVKAHM